MDLPPPLVGSLIDDAYHYWLGLDAVRSPPARRQIDPVAMSKLLGWIMLTDVLPEPPHYRYRLIGQHIADRLPELARGMPPLSSSVNPLRPGGDELANMIAVTRSRQPRVFLGRGRIQQRHLPIARLDCPMVEDGAEISLIFSCLLFRGS